MPQLIGPFTQAITMKGLAEKGPLKDDVLEIIPNAGIRIAKGKILEIGSFDAMHKNGEIVEISTPQVLLPGFVDAHTHLCYAGTRAEDYALRLNGESYPTIAARGGGILDTVKKTRSATQEQLTAFLIERLEQQRALGVTTCEIKSGYGLSVEEELKMLRAIKAVSQKFSVIPTCLAAHTVPQEFQSAPEYLNYLIDHLLPTVLAERLSTRIDIFVDKGAFSIEEARSYLIKSREMGFSLVIHADQFSPGAALLAAELGAVSADHLEQSTVEEARALKKGNVFPIVLPGASLGLGMPFPPARMLLDEGLPLVIASDWNPGSAPMGNLLTQAAVLGAAQKLTMAETFAALTIRAAKALQLNDRGELAVGKRADAIAFPCADYREILYYQGSLHPVRIIC